MDLDGARAVFLQFKEALGADEALRSEVVVALETLIAEYDTGIRENRFVAGGATEHILGSAMRAVGIPAKNKGQAAVLFDIDVDDVGFSVKASFQARPADIRLINTLGPSSVAVWTTPTLLVVANLGIAYVDPDLLPDSTRSTGDALILKRAAWLPFVQEHHEWLCELPIGANPKNPATKVASYAIAEEILSRPNFEALRRNRTSLAPG